MIIKENHRRGFMKINSIIAQCICMALFLTTVTPIQSQFAPIETQPTMRKWVDDKYNAALQKLQDFKNCFTGKKECSQQEKRVKTAVVMGALLTVISILVFILRKAPKIVTTRIKEGAIDDKVKKLIVDIDTLRPTISELNKKSIRREYREGMVLQPGATIQSYTVKEEQPDPYNPGKNRVVEVKKQLVVPADDPEAQKIGDMFAEASQQLENIQLAMQTEFSSEKKRKKAATNLERDVNNLRDHVTKLQKALLLKALPQ